MTSPRSNGCSWFPVDFFCKFIIKHYEYCLIITCSTFFFFYNFWYKDKVVKIDQTCVKIVFLSKCFAGWKDFSVILSHQCLKPPNTCVFRLVGRLLLPYSWVIYFQYQAHIFESLQLHLLVRPSFPHSWFHPSFPPPVRTGAGRRLQTWRSAASRSVTD